MLIYFRIRYLVKDEFDTEEQIDYIRRHVEEIGGEKSLLNAGLKYERQFSRNFINFEGKEMSIAMVGYSLTDSCDMTKIEKVMNKNEIKDELSVYVSLV